MSTFEYMGRKTCKADNPLLVIGLGGGGVNGVLRVKELFAKRFEPDVDCNGKAIDKPEGVSYLVLDSVANTIDMRYNGTRLDSGEFVDLTVTGLPAMLNVPAYLKPYQHDWLDERYQNDFNNGAGGIRQVGRLLFMLHSEMIYGRLKKEIASLLARTSWQYKGNCLSVAVITSVVGGTGSGIFLDMAYLLRRVIKDSFPGIEIDITAYVIMPELTIHRVGAYAAVSRGLEANGFAALKELDYWMGEAGRNHEHIQQYGEGIYFNWQDEAPFDEVILLSGMDQNGSMNQDAYSQALDAAALHLMADIEAGYPQDWLMHTDGYYRRIRIYVGALNQMLTEKYQANCVYTALGVASVEAPSDEMFDYEASLLMQNIVAMEAKMPDMESNAVQLLGEAVIPLKGRYNQVKRGAPMPDWEKDAQAPTSAAANEFRTTGEAYHTDKLDKWRSQVANKCMKNSFFGDPDAPKNNGFIQECWVRFCNSVQTIIKNTQQGPYYLEEMLLNDEHGLVAWIDKKIQEADGDVIKGDQDISNHISTADSYLPKVLKPSLADRGLEVAMPKTSSFSRYLNTCLTVYEETRKRAYAQQLVEMLKAFKSMVEGYAKYSLHAYNECVRELNKRLSGASDAVNTTGTLVDFAKLRSSIQNRFSELNNEDSMTKQLLSAIAEQSVNYTGERNAANARAEKARFARSIEAFVNETFADLNEVNLDNMLQIAVGTDRTWVEMENLVAQRWAPRLIDKAEPKFPSRAEMKNEPSIDACYALIPYNARIFMRGFERFAVEYNSRIVIKESGIKDRIILIRTRSALPLCAYAPLRGMEDAYKASLQNEWRGLHLLGEWRNLPSPILNEWAEGESRD